MKSLLIALLACACTGFAHADLVTNGGFENSPLGTGWSTGGGEVDILPVSAYITCCGIDGSSYPYGQNAAFFGAGDVAGGSLWQDIHTVAGQSYNLSFLYGALAQANLQTMTVQVLDGSTVLASLNVGAYGTFDQTEMVSPFSKLFTADSSTTRIEFTDTSAITNSTDGIVDNVSVTAAVPEPESYALLLVGMGVLVARRRALRA